MNLNELREALRAKQVDLWVEGDLLRFRMPENALDKKLLGELRRHKKALIEQLKQEAPVDRSSSRLEPLSVGQQALYFLHSLAPQSPAYNVAACVRIASSVDVAVMRHAFQTLVSRHESLRTTFETIDGNPRCRIHPQMDVDFRQISASDWDDSQLHDTVKREYQHPFDLGEGPLLRIRLFTVSERDHVFLMTLHHIVFDAWSLWLLQDEFQQLYRQLADGETPVLPTLSASYSDFVREQNELQHSSRGEQLWNYWRERLAGDLVAPDLPLDYPRPDRPNQIGATHKFRVSRKLAQQLKELGKSLGATPFMVMLAVFKTLIFRYTGQDDLTVGTTTSGRSAGAYTRVIGYFVNTLAVRTGIPEATTFAEYLHHVKKRTLEAIEHQDYPFPLLVDRLNPRRDTGRLPICSVMFGLQKPQQFNEATRLFDEGSGHADWGGMEVYPYDLPQQEGQFDLTLEMFDADDSFLGTLKYDTDLFSAETAERMGGHFLRLAESIAQDPNRPLTEYDMACDSELQQIRSFSGSTTAQRPTDPRAHRLFESQVNRAPDRIAVVDDDQSLTYDQLNGRANQVARHLQQLGITCGDTVACHVSRGIPTAVATLAVFKIGATYVPLDPTSPRSRLQIMLKDCAAKVLLSHSSFHEHENSANGDLRDYDHVRVVCLDQIDHQLGGQDRTNLELDVDPESIAYIIYTSGSTGQPKGVCVSHGAFAQHVLSIRERFGLIAKDRMLQFSNTTFDPSLEQMFVPWSVGASVLVRGNELWSPDEFWERVRSHQLTAVNLPPAYFRHCTDALEPNSDDAESLRLIIVGGDVFPADTLAAWRPLGVRILNAYGPTEAVITATVHEVSNHPTDRLRVPIGSPKPGLRAYVLDRHGRFAPIGVPGELVLGGPMLATGYLNNPEKTSSKFVADPFAADERAMMYRTGDCVRWTPEGELEFLGRRDRQIKIHGFRVEIGEIESSLDAHAAVRESHVQARCDAHGDSHLVAWLSVDRDRRPKTSEIRTHLRDRLPAYMVPRHFVFVDRLPLNGSGKVDTDKLPEPKRGRPRARKYVAPQNAMEQTLVDIWQRVLEVDTVGTHDNFFDLGGSSLTSLRIIAALNDAGLEVKGDHVKPEILFEYPTVAEIAAFWETYSSSSSSMG